MDQISGEVETSRTLLKPRPLLPTLWSRILRALAELAETFEILAAEGSTRVPDQEHGFRKGLQYKGNSPRITERGLLQCVVGVLQQFQNASTPICLRDLSVETCDGPVVLRSVLEFVEECLHLTVGLDYDEFVASSS